MPPKMSAIKLLGRRSKRNFILCWLSLTIVFILYTDYFTYYFCHWSRKHPSCDDDNLCTKILLVADPQIIGNNNEELHYLTPISIFDSDRYLKKTFLVAFNLVDPDIVIFLGDIMDEGSIAYSNGEFEGYLRRVYNIFLTTDNKVKYIWLPGDNDIGGEGADRITENKIRRFNRAFSQPDIIHVNNYTFFKVNAMTRQVPVYKKAREFYDTSEIFIGLSHMPLMYLPTRFVDGMLAKMLPQLLFTAHEHKSMIIRTDALLRADRQIVPVRPEDNEVYEYELGVTDMFEISVPTCSYRMGTNKVGFGFAILEKNRLRYSVLWSPSRFDQLTNYWIFVTCFVIISFCFYCCRLYKYF